MGRREATVPTYVPSCLKTSLGYLNSSSLLACEHQPPDPSVSDFLAPREVSSSSFAPRVPCLGPL